MTRHMLGLFNNRPGARGFRRHISENAPRHGAGIEVLRDAQAQLLKPEYRQLSVCCRQVFVFGKWRPTILTSRILVLDKVD